MDQHSARLQERLDSDAAAKAKLQEQMRQEMEEEMARLRGRVRQDIEVSVPLLGHFADQLLIRRAILKKPKIFLC